MAADRVLHGMRGLLKDHSQYNDDSRKHPQLILQKRATEPQKRAECTNAQRFHG
jgi:hypothetical protein